MIFAGGRVCIGRSFVPNVCRYKVKAPDFLCGMRIVFASDMHISPRVPDRVLTGLADAVAGEKPDLILLGGDYAEDEKSLFRMFDALRELSAPMGIFGVPGNNDWECADEKTLQRAMEHANCRLLLNEGIRLPAGNGEIHICGVDEFKHGRPCYDHLPRQAAQNSFCVLLSHYPLLPADGHADLALCGHTHAGQFRLLGLTPYSLPTERDTMPHGPDLIFGQKKFGDTRMIVCAGTGTSKIPLRINAVPEIVSIEFEKGFAKP